jgi:hypothetical protein
VTGGGGGGGALKVNAPILVVEPPVAVTPTDTVPAPWDGDRAVNSVELTMVHVASDVPKVTRLSPVKFEPVMLTAVPPEVGPLVGATDEMVGAATKLNMPAAVTVPPGVVTETTNVPAPWLFVFALMVVGLVTETSVASVEPNLTDVVVKPKPLKSFPVMVTVVPPEVGPLRGVKLVIPGEGYAKVNDVALVTVPWVVSTDTSTFPGVWLGVFTVSSVAPVACTAEAADAPKVTPVADVRWVPLIVTLVSPVVRPLGGVIEVIVGGLVM